MVRGCISTVSLFFFARLTVAIMETNNQSLYLKGEIIMLNEVNKLIEEVNEVMDLYAKEMFDFDMLESMDKEEFVLMQKVLKLKDASFDLTRKQAEMIDEMNAKLDKLLAMTEAKAQ